MYYSVRRIITYYSITACDDHVVSKYSTTLIPFVGPPGHPMTHPAPGIPTITAHDDDDDDDDDDQCS